MDDTQQSRASDAGATRKRRSSILKSQRPARTPFSELEFNVATPTDTAKSRRVSFSRRTGVAEFVTNEATTTWKNFYEEHNKSLESSGNDSGANATRQPIGHLGKRIFEQQFEEVEAQDFITSLDNLAGRNVNSTMNVNFTQQLASLECTDSIKPTAPQNNFELSALTDHHSKLFSDDLAIPMMGEMSGRIDVNFSAVQSIDVKDDLDEIQRDIERQSNVVGPVQFRDGRDFSEYIEVDLNSTHAAIKNEESDMSITETIPSPKVSRTLSPPDKKSSLNWVDDKENKLVNDLDIKSKSVVFDGNADMSITTAIPSKLSQESTKRRTIVFDDGLDDLSLTKPLPVKLMVDNKEDKHTDKLDHKAKSLIFENNADMSITAVIPGKITQEPEKRRTMLFDDDLGDLSMTKALPTKIMYDEKENSRLVSDIKAKSLIFNRNTDMSMTEVIPGKLNQEPEKRRTMIFDDDLGDLSMTKPIPAKLLSVHSEIIDKSNLNTVFDEMDVKLEENTTEKRKTILFDDDLGNLSMTKPISASLLSAHNTLLGKSTSNHFNASNLQSKENVSDKRKTILFEDDLGNLSMTKPIPTEMLSVHSDIINKSNFNKSGAKPNENVTEKRKTILFEDDLADLSMTKPISAQMLPAQSDIINKYSLNEYSHKSNLQPDENTTEKRKTILFDDDMGNLSLTKSIPTKLLSVHSDIVDRSNVHDKFNKSNSYKDCTASNKEYSKEQPMETATEKRKTILFDEDLGDLSMTKPIPAQLISVHSEIIDKSNVHVKFDQSNMHKSRVYEEKAVNITKQDDGENLADMSISPEIQQPEEGRIEKRKTIIFDGELGNLSITTTIPSELLSIQSKVIKPTQELSNQIDIIRGDEKRKTTLFPDETCDLSITKPIPANIFDIQNKELNRSKEIDSKETELISLDFSKFKARDVVVFQVATNDTSNGQGMVGLSESSVLQNKGDVTTSSCDIEKMDASVKEEDITEKKATEELPYKELQKDEEVSEQAKEDRDVSRNVSVESVVRNVSAMRTYSIASKKSILCDLLDMSDASIVSGFDHKEVLVKLSSEKPSIHNTRTLKTDAGSERSVGSDIFYITRDTDSETQSNDAKERNTSKGNFDGKESSHKHLPVVLLEESVPNMVDTVQSALSQMKESNREFDSSNTPQLVDVGVVTDGTSVVAIPNNDTQMDVCRVPKSFKEADNTKELLDMISDLTDNQQSISSEDKISPTIVKGRLALENKECNEPKRVSIAPNRQSIVLSREDLLNNISMAQAALQQSIDMEDSDVEEPTPAVAISPPKKTVRVSNDSGVVKTLHFEDESLSEASIRSDLRSPLKKTAFGETSYMKESNKSNVIPSYLKDVSDGMKALMRDLVKPMADEQPFEAVALGKVAKTSPSSCSTQIQANLCTSSQIDITNDLTSNPRSITDMESDDMRIVPSPKSAGKSVSFISTDVNAQSDLVSRHLKEASFRPKRHPPEQSVPGRVLVFDHENPLNNVLLTPHEYTEVHKYSPAESENINRSESDRSHSMHSVKGREEYEVESVSVKYKFGSYRSGCPSGDSGAEIPSKNDSLTSNLSKPVSIDQSICARVTEVKDIEVNTAIAMKKNKELLEASSSLTLVDDALASVGSGVKCTAPLRVIYTLNGDVRMGMRLESDLTSNDEDAKPKKRMYSPSSSEKCSSQSSNYVTPKPLSKMQRRSDSPKSRNMKLKQPGNSLIPERDTSSAESKMDVDKSPGRESPKRRSPRKKNSPKKGGVSITVQQLLTEFKVAQDIDQQDLNKQILDALSRTDSSVPESISDGGVGLDMVGSYGSSNKQCKQGYSMTTTATDDSHFELECASSMNVVAKIDMLSFMGSHECEWASSGTDSWSFRLLHGRLRLNIRLAHRHHNATRTRVRGDTPVTSVTVHQTHRGNDKKNAVAMTCITFAAEAIRACAEVACERAGDVPALLRRGAGVAKMAMRWGRAMHDARMHLAYKLSEDRVLVLNVANIPLRCVWEVTMRLELVKQENALPWPKACDVRVVGVLDNRAAGGDALRRLLAGVPGNWGHVPNTIWKVFKYLKNKTPEQEALDL